MHFDIANGLSLLLLSLQDIQDQTQPPLSNSHPDGPVTTTSTPQTATATSIQAEKAVPNKSLLDWLRQQSDYTLDVPGFGTVRVSLTTACVSILCMTLCLRLSWSSLGLKLHY